LDQARLRSVAVRREAALDLARQLVGARGAGPGSSIHAIAVVTAEALGAVDLELEGPARRVEGRGGHPFEHAAPAPETNVGRVERDALDHGVARPEIAREDHRAVASVQDQPGIAVDDERPG